MKDVGLVHCNHVRNIAVVLCTLLSFHHEQVKQLNSVPIVQVSKAPLAVECFTVLTRTLPGLGRSLGPNETKDVFSFLFTNP